ncbi:MAG: PilZ domain-containing protein [Tepidisphaeraceae bacterium]|jgi:c-di-GMP-binding flagellar brake protein YcgR
MAESHTEVLDAAVARNVGAVLSVPTAGMPRNLKTRFLGEEADCLWLEVEAAASGILDAAARDGQGVGVAFKTGTRTIMFATKVLELRAEYRMNSQVLVPAVRVERPAEIKSVQRRTNYRVKIVDSSELLVRAWRIPDNFVLRDRPPAAMEMCVEPRDLSAGGISLLVKSSGTGNPIRIVEGQRLRLLLRHADSEVLLEAFVRHAVETPGGQQRLGVQFGKADADMAGRQALSKLNMIVSALAREEVRQLRLSS